MTTTDATSPRSRAKSDRRGQLIGAAERLIAEHGYLAVRLEDIGAQGFRRQTAGHCGRSTGRKTPARGFGGRHCIR